MNQLDIMIAGFGGQGILFAGKLLAYAGLAEDRHVSWLPSYGPEMRGGTANCSVCLSDESICSPLVTAPNILVVMNEPSFDKFIGTVSPGGLVVMDSSLIGKGCPRDDVTVCPVPATSLATEQKLDGFANLILLGSLYRRVKFCGKQALQQALEQCTAGKESLLVKNQAAFLLGENY